MKAFVDLVVVELASILAGPLAGTFFAEQGARVYKIENKKTGGDPTRNWGKKTDGSISAYYASANFGKQVHMLDLEEKTDHALLMGLVEEADIVISNYKPSSAIRLRIAETDLRKVNPDLIIAHLIGFPHEEGRPTFDAALQAEAGWMSVNGNAETGPMKMPMALVDVLAAEKLKAGILTAMLKKAADDMGYNVFVSLFESALSGLINQASDHLMNGTEPRGMGSLHPHIAPYGETFKTNDGKFILLAVGTNKQFNALSGLFNLGSDELFKTNQLRLKNRIQLGEKLKKVINNRSSSELAEDFENFGIPYSMVRTIPEVFASDDTNNFVLQEEIDSTSTSRVRTSGFWLEAAKPV